MTMEASPSPRLVLVKHARPVLDPSRPPREWQLDAAGEAQAVALAARLARFRRMRLVTSEEPKAARTGAIVGAALGVPAVQAPGLHELERPRTPILSPEAHAAANHAVFADPDRPAFGLESAAAARARFSRALARELAASSHRHLVVVAHGTVIALLVARHNAVDAFAFWRRLDCGASVVLARPSLALVAIIEPPG